MELAEEDERALAAFAGGGGAGPGRTLAAVILERLRASGAAGGGGGESDEEAAAPADMDPAVAEVYRGVGALLARYKSGKVPKAFKIIPALSNWEEVLYLTRPEAWTPHATFQATRLFASNLNARMAQRFFNLVLLPAVRADVAANRRLHFTLFCALKKATYKPAAFFKGVLLPLCQAGDCTLREAVILSSVLMRTSIPMLHSAAALLKVAEMDYSGTNRRACPARRMHRLNFFFLRSFFIRVLLDKKYALPYRVLDALVAHFLRFADESRALPVVWHQSLLTFVQRYKRELAAADKERLRGLAGAQRHYLMTPEVLRELAEGQSRCVPPAAARPPAHAPQRRGGAGGGDGAGAGGAGGCAGAPGQGRARQRRGETVRHAAGGAHGSITAV